MMLVKEELIPKILLVIAFLIIITAPSYAHNWNGEVKGKNWCQEYEQMIGDGKIFPDGRQTHEYMEQCGISSMHSLSEKNISNMESYLKARMGDRYPDRYPDDDSRN